MTTGTETRALDEARGPWIHELSLMAGQLLAEGVPLGGICLYPILGLPEWHARGAGPSRLEPVADPDVEEQRIERDGCLDGNPTERRHDARRRRGEVDLACIGKGR